MKNKFFLLDILGVFVSAGFGLAIVDLSIKFIFSLSDSIISVKDPQVMFTAGSGIILIIGVFVVYLKWLEKNNKNKLIGVNVLAFFICIVFGIRIWNALLALKDLIIIK